MTKLNTFCAGFLLAVWYVMGIILILSPFVK